MCTDQYPAVKVRWSPTLMNINWLNIGYTFILPPQTNFPRWNPACVHSYLCMNLLLFWSLLYNTTLILYTCIYRYMHLYIHVSSLAKGWVLESSMEIFRTASLLGCWSNPPLGWTFFQCIFCITSVCCSLHASLPALVLCGNTNTMKHIVIV